MKAGSRVKCIFPHNLKFICYSSNFKANIFKHSLFTGTFYKCEVHADRLTWLTLQAPDSSFDRSSDKGFKVRILFWSAIIYPRDGRNTTISINQKEKDLIGNQNIFLKNNIIEKKQHYQVEANQN